MEENARLVAQASRTVSKNRTSMSAHALKELEFDGKTRKRAQYEAYEFEVIEPGLVRATNTSHANPENHQSLVTIENGVPVECGCPSDEYHPKACKHRVSTAIETLVIITATPEQDTQDTQNSPDTSTDTTPTPIADGGEVTNHDEQDTTDTEGCQFDTESCTGIDQDGFTCFDCYMADGLDHYPDDRMIDQ